MSVTLDDDEEMRVRALQSWMSPLFPTQTGTVPAFSGVSSLSSCTEEASSPQNRPVLESPMWKILRLQQEMEKLTSKNATIFHEEATRTLEEIDQCTKQKEEAFEKAAKEAQSRSTWGALSNVAQYITGAGSIVAGAAMGGTFGPVVIIAGAIGLTYRSLQDTHLLQTAVEWYTHSEERKTQILQNIEMGIFCIQMATLFSSLAAASSLSALEAIQSTSNAVKNASGIMAMGTRFGADFHNKRFTELQALTKKLNATSTLRNQDIWQETTNMNRAIEQTQQATEQVKKAVRSIDIPQD